MKTTKLKLAMQLVVVATAACSGSAANAATIVYNNLGTSPNYYSNAGNPLGGSSSVITATTFVPSASGQLDELALGLVYLTGTNSVTLRLSPDVSGLPSAPIWQTSVPPVPVYGQLLTVTGIGGPTLNASQTYWLESVAPNSSTVHTWAANNQGYFGPMIGSGAYLANAQLSSLRVGVVTVPEPAAGLLMVCGVLGFGQLCRRRR